MAYALRIKHLAFAAAGALAVLLFNLSIPSLLNFYFWSDKFTRWQTYVAYIVELHREVVGAFIRRPLTTYFIDTIANNLSLSYWISFLIVQFILLTIAADQLGVLAQRVSGMRVRLATIVIFFLSFTILFSFATPNDSYDEAVQYLFLFMAIRTIYLRRAYLFMPVFFLSLVARESSVLVLPGLFLLDRAFSRRPAWMELVKFAVPIAAYAVYFYLLGNEEDPNRFLYWQKNFADLKTTFETCVSLFLALGIPMIILLTAVKAKIISWRDPWMRAFLVTLAINTPVVMLTTYARESRLYALPLVFLWPIAGALFLKLADAYRERTLKFRENPAMGLTLFAALFIVFVYNPNYRHVLGYQVCAVLYALLLAAPLAATRDAELLEK